MENTFQRSRTLPQCIRILQHCKKSEKIIRISESNTGICMAVHKRTRLVSLNPITARFWLNYFLFVSLLHRAPWVLFRAPRVPIRAPQVLIRTPRVPVGAPRVPDRAPRVPDRAPRVPNRAPRVPDRIPRVPDITPRVPNRTP